MNESDAGFDLLKTPQRRSNAENTKESLIAGQRLDFLGVKWCGVESRQPSFPTAICESYLKQNQRPHLNVQFQVQLFGWQAHPLARADFASRVN